MRLFSLYALCLLALLYFCCPMAKTRAEGGDASKPDEVTQPQAGFSGEEGEFAADFSLQRLDGSTFQLSDYRGKKAVYLVFWNTWCGHCIKKVPALKARYGALKDQIEFLAINTSWSDSPALINDFIAEYQTNYPMALDDGARITKQYKVWGSPTEFIIDINGVIQLRDGIPEDWQPHIAQWNHYQTECRQEELC
ncbi:peroxiredoxin family protein [Corallincola platygyrae]|uniref:Peroxiredoxin family protein n=1 Tax=Corallincola platygyrae TaxID=1193278 RepID=A0ABW4XGB2_9GAMM